MTPVHVAHRFCSETYGKSHSKFSGLRVLVILTVVPLGLAACAGGGASGNAVPTVASGMPTTQLSSAASTMPVSIVISIPSSTQTSSSRSSAYVSAGTKSVSVSVSASGEASPPATVSNCSTSCSVNLTAPVGDDLFSVVLYDSINGSGNKLSIAQTTQNVMATQINTVKLALGGVVASLAIASLPSFQAGTAANATLNVTAKDAAGYTIIGSDSFVTPITLSTSDTSGAFSVSTQQLATPASTGAIVYSGSGASNASVTAAIAGSNVSTTSALVAVAPVAVAPSHTVKYGVFTRANGTPPYGMFTSTGSLDPTKTQNILDIGASWTRFETSPYFIDQTFFGPGRYDFANVDTLENWEKSHNIEAVVGIEAGPVQVNDNPAVFAPHEIPVYSTSAAFATYCGVMANHMSGLGVHSFSEPGNEINADTTKFPNGAASVAPYARDCYKAIKAADPSAFVWGLELSEDGSLNPAGFVKNLLALGCGPGTCYDGISVHLSLRYPIPPAGTPCYPNAGGDYGVACVSDAANASGNPALPMMIGETVITWSGMVPDAATKAIADPAELRAFAAMPSVRYINFANLDECALYPSGYFANGCLVDLNNAHVPAWQGVYNVFTGH